MIKKATAQAHPNIAFIKYWGLKDELNRIPANDSLSMNIGSLTTQTTVTFDPSLEQDEFILNNKRNIGKGLTRTQDFMDRVRKIADVSIFARIESVNDFPTGAGVASSASGFAALALAASSALGLDLTTRELSSLARFGSGSACRSIPGGFVEWHTDPKSGESYAESIAPANHWQLMDCIAIISEQHKSIGSQAGMRLANTSPFQAARVLDSKRRLELCRSAILNKDFDALSEITELDSNMMHAVMMTSDPSLFYWEPQSLAIMKAVKDWQKEGLAVTYTLDAGPNVHAICTLDAFDEVLSRLGNFPGVKKVLHGGPGGPARLIPSPDKTSS
jgi:diphosphomevalonate decarboxylase